MYNEFYKDSFVTLHNGDCREILPLIGEIDTIITDPVWPNCPEGLLCGYENPEKIFIEMIDSLYCLPKRLIVILRGDSDPRFLRRVPKGLPFLRTQILPYVMPGYYGRKLGGDEIAYCFGEFVLPKNGKRLIPGWAPKSQPNNRKKNGHPCSRSLLHMKFLIKWWVDENDVFVDPFCGSGTLLLAGKEMGVKSIGIEIEKKYCDIAKNRLSQHVFNF